MSRKLATRTSRVSARLIASAILDFLDTDAIRLTITDRLKADRPLTIGYAWNREDSRIDMSRAGRVLKNILKNNNKENEKIYVVNVEIEFESQVHSKHRKQHAKTTNYQYKTTRFPLLNSQASVLIQNEPGSQSQTKNKNLLPAVQFCLVVDKNNYYDEQTRPSRRIGPTRFCRLR